MNADKIKKNFRLPKRRSVFLRKLEVLLGSQTLTYLNLKSKTTVRQ